MKFPPFGGAIVFFLITSIFLLNSPAHAVQYRTVQYSNGTGFFINNDGYLLTNAHVVEKCRSAQISGVGMVARAQILDMDKEIDMALLQANMPPNATAIFRDESLKLNAGDPLVIVGHPLGKSLTTKTSSLIADRGPMGEDKWLQFSNSIFQGNSGGPLLDSAGQVVGMITAKSTLYRYNPQLAKNEVVGNSDIAIQAHMLENFLAKSRIKVNKSSREVKIPPQQIENTAKNYVVQIKCIIEG